ncbi:long-chain-fatty-acid--CoA ligase ACSBG2-like isoform X2 [Dysidea avara]|uniref:long-chain-fatty-acid--CoA ligase ACSBG2-like isoform X2 n=1 Tax=Dysidea avara TaxID=196820 RepID=UPI003325014E
MDLGDNVDSTTESHSHDQLPRKLRCFDPSDTVDITMGESGVAAIKPVTIPEYYQSTFDKMPHKKALCWKDNKDGPWESLTYGEYKKLIFSVAKSLLKLGLEPFHTVATMGCNSVESFACSIGTVYAGGISTGVYTTGSVDICQYILDNSKADVIMVDDQGENIHKIAKIRDKLPHLKAIVQYKGEVIEDYPDIYNWTQFLALGKDTENSVIDDIISKQQPNQCAMLVYTSGTTGVPKGVMLSHDNLTWTVEYASEFPEEVWHCGVSYLPLCYIGVKVLDMILPISVGGTVYLAQPDALKGSLFQTLVEVQPTFFQSAPRLWEEIKKKIQASDNKNKEAHGFGSCDIMLTGGAPMHRDTVEYFMTLGMPIINLYGMSESTGAVTRTRSPKARHGSCGTTNSGMEIKISNPDQHGIGEICTRGRKVFMGYLGMEQKTKETIDDEGWLHTGDLGRMDEEGSLYVVGRIKELVLLNNTEKISPDYVEGHIKNEIPFLSNVVLIGEGRKYLTCLLTQKILIVEWPRIIFSHK